MKLRSYILLIGIAIGGILSPLRAQYLEVVCAGDTAMSYHVEGTEGSTFEWTVQGGEIRANYGDSILVDWGTVPGEYELRVQETSEYGCISEPKTALILLSRPMIELGDDAYICEGETFSLDPEGYFYSYQWHDNSMDSIYTTNISETISVTVSDRYGCYWSDEMFLEVKPLPVVELGRDTSLCGEQSVFLNAGNDGVEYLWSTGENSWEIEVFQGFQELNVLVTDEYGCQNSDSLVISSCDPEQFFSDIPTAITPDDDGINEVWIIEKLEAYPDAVVDIYDRWGRLIWRSEPGYPEPWDGTNLRGQLVPMDSYHYVILLNFGDDDRVVGAITVIK